MMPIDTVFRLSFFLTLGLACITLSIAGYFFTPWVLVILAITLALLARAWYFPDRWLLNEQASNYLGIVIGVGTLGWILLQLPRNEEEFVKGGVSYPAGLLPHLGPLLMILLAIKIYRPKNMEDFWVLQTIGLMMVTLGCVLGAEFWFVFAMVAYVGSLVWCLTLYHHFHEQQVEARTLDQPLLAQRTQTRVWNWRWFGVRQSLAWLGAVLLVGIVLFFVSPRFTNLHWEPMQLSVRSPAFMPGQTFLGGIDIGKVGTVKLSTDPAFEVVVTDADGKPKGLPLDTYFRNDIYDLYVRGKWSAYDSAGSARGRESTRMTLPPPAQSPFRDAEVLSLRFQVRPVEAKGLVLADPIDFHRIGKDPYIGKERPTMDLGLFVPVLGNDSVSPFIPSRRAIFRYTQDLPRVNPETVPVQMLHEGYVDDMLSRPVPEGVALLAKQIVTNRLGDEPEEQADELKRKRFVYPIAKHEKVAEEICAHLTRSGEYTYTLELRREDLSIDATQDFLTNVREGNCDRYAGAMTLMLRGLGVPARVVQGYYGAFEDEENPGLHVIRQDQAHSWVEVLLRDREPWQWKRFDPTPSTETALSAQSWWDWFMGNIPEPTTIWRNIIMNYNADAQLTLVRSFGPYWLAIAGTLFGLMLVALAVWWLPAAYRFVVGLVPRRNQAALSQLLDPPPPYYQRWLSWARQHLHAAPTPAQTPLEFAHQVSSHPRLGAFRSLPTQIVAVLYAERFGGKPLDADALASLEHRLADLEKSTTG